MVTGCKLRPKPHHERAEPGKNNLLFDQLFKKKKNERKETASLSADSLFNQLHKKCTEKNKNHIVQIYVTSTPKEIIKQ